MGGGDGIGMVVEGKEEENVFRLEIGVRLIPGGFCKEGIRVHV